MAYWLMLSLVAMVLWGIVGLLQKVTTNRISADAVLIWDRIGYVVILPLLVVHTHLTNLGPKDMIIGTLDGITNSLGALFLYMSLESGAKAFVVLFRLSCLNMINQRFGSEPVEDCLMAVSAFLTESLHSDDAIYHWSDSSLLAVLLGRANDQILTAELERIAMQNRETTVNIGGRATMLRIPITFDLIPIERLKSADDLYKITLLTNSGRTR